MVMSIAGLTNTLSTSPKYFTFFTFLDAIGTAGITPLAFIIGIELVGRKKREFTGIVQNYFYAVGEAMLGLVAWWKPDWVKIQLMISAPPIIFLTYYWIIPESIRWLIAKKRIAEAEKIIRSAAKMNGKVLTNKAVSLLSSETGWRYEKSKVITPKPINDSWNLLKQMLAYTIIIYRALILFFTW